MDWILPFPAPAVCRVPCPNLPTGFVRTLLSDCKIPFGARVLDIGPANARLQQQLLFLGGKPEALHTSGASGHLDRLLRNLPARAYDLVLMRAGLGNNRDLLDPAALDATAQLLALVRPAGHLILLNRREPAWEALPGGHLQSCFARHLACFGTSSHVFQVHDGPLNWRTWSWLAGRRPRSGYLAARLTIDERPRDVAGWRHLAENRERHPAEFCCLWARRLQACAPVAPARGAVSVMRRVA